MNCANLSLKQIITVYNKGQPTIQSSVGKYMKWRTKWRVGRSPPFGYLSFAIPRRKGCENFLGWRSAPSPFYTPLSVLCTNGWEKFIIRAYVHLRLSLKFLGLKIKNLKIRDGGLVKEFRPNLLLWFPAWSDVNSWSSVFLKILDDLGRGLDALTVQRVPVYTDNV